MMDTVYKVFYLVFMANLSITVLFPCMVLCRIVLRKLPKKEMLALWFLFFLRAVCPYGITSSFVLFPVLNDTIHKLMIEMGAYVSGGMDLTEDVMVIWNKTITTTLLFKTCTITWVIGGIFILVLFFIRERQGKRALIAAFPLMKGFYQTSRTKTPRIYGLFRRKVYIPNEVVALEAKTLLRHMEIEKNFLSRLCHYFYVMVCCIHWYNPLVWLAFTMWKQDHEMAADEKQCKGMSEKQRKDYAQEVINFDKGKDRLPIALFSHKEMYVTQRATRILYYQKGSAWKKAAFGIIFSVVFICSYLLSFLQSARNGQTWKNIKSTSTTVVGEVETKGTIVAEKNVDTPNGLPQKIQLMMEIGKKNKESFQGNFILRMVDGYDNKITQEKINDIFDGNKDIKEGNRLEFPTNLSLCTSDYNNDGITELCLGRVVKKSKDFLNAESKKSSQKQNEIEVGEYYLFAIGNDTITLCSDPVYQTATGGAIVQSSVSFEPISESPSVFCSQVGKQKLYYIWKEEDGKYERSELSKQQLSNLKKGGELDESEEKVQTHTLADTSGTIHAKVLTKKVGTKDEEIQSVVLISGTEEKEFKDVQGYYCDLQWATTEDGSQGRYVQLTYNGMHSRTFVLYDLKTKGVLYRQEDGNHVLQECLKQYQTKDISLSETGLVIYQLQELKTNGELKIGYAAQTKSKKNINGNYIYDLEQNKTKEFSYSEASAFTNTKTP